MHVFVGKSGYQLGPFSTAVKKLLKLNRNVTCFIEYKCIGELPKHWTPSDLIDWLTDCDFHFILTHTHQSIEDFNCNEVVKELQRLRGHKGFPQDDELGCSIFLQDKRVYIEGMLYITMHILTFALFFCLIAKVTWLLLLCKKALRGRGKKIRFSSSLFVSNRNLSTHALFLGSEGPF